MMKKQYIIIIAALLGLFSCNDESNFDILPEDCDPIVLRGIHAIIDNGDGSTRAVTPLVDSIGKYNFLATDQIVFTTIERTKRPIRPTFSYKGVEYSCQISDQSISWKREQPTNDIFWSDGSEPHTFIGYILPHEDNSTAQPSNYDWHHYTDKDVYYGSIGDPTVTVNDTIDYTGSPQLGEDQAAPYDTEKLRKEDLLLTYSTEMQNEDAMAQVHFHHGLASIRVTVTITGYSSTGEDPDAKTEVTDMVVHNQPTMFKWDNKGFRAAPLVEGDQTILNSFTDWGGTTPAWNQKKEMKLWQPRKFHGTGASRTFTFYGITAPGKQEKVDMTFKVSYPDPLDPNHENPNRLKKTYNATLQLPDSRKVEFRPGYCTSININLNHKDEKLTVGAEYMSWEFDPSPNEGKLRKNSTYLSYTDRSEITIVGDEKATVDDATWLYAGTSGAIYDIYGNDGSEDHPYLICTADQLLSFAYEVKEGESGNGRKFTGKYIKLDADITMQPEKNVAESNRKTWIGVGDGEHPFDGIFLGSGRYINDLYGEHFFHTIGENAVIDKLNFGSVIEVQGCGVIAHENKGLICGCYINGDVKETDTSSQYTGSIVGINQSFIIACAHEGDVYGRGTVGGLVGFNNGNVMACYHAGEVSALDSSNNVHPTVGKSGDGNDGTNNSIMFSCYYDKNLYDHDHDLIPGKTGFPLSTGIMQNSAFVGKDENDKSFVFEETGNVSTDGPILRVIAETVVKERYPSMTEQEITAKTDQELILLILPADVFSDEVLKVFEYHFSLNTAIRVFKYWIARIHAQQLDNVETNCHTFTKAQIDFLYEHYNAEHQYYYTPATYPKVR